MKLPWKKIWPDETPQTRACDIPGCPGHGEHRAPKSRLLLREFYWFCLDHVRAYNLNWDYFQGMSQSEIERHMHEAVTWERPTWEPRQRVAPDVEKLRQTLHRGFRFSGAGFFSDDDPENDPPRIPDIPSADLEALAILGISPPTDMAEIKAQYKKLVKKHHPDANGGDKQAEEMIKRINVSYGILKLAYERYTNLETGS